MGFKYSVIGDNTPENRKWSEKLEYTVLNFGLNGKYLYTQLDVHGAIKIRHGKSPIIQYLMI